MTIRLLLCRCGHLYWTKFYDSATSTPLLWAQEKVIQINSKKKDVPNARLLLVQTKWNNQASKTSSKLMVWLRGCLICKREGKIKSHCRGCVQG